MTLRLERKTLENLIEKCREEEYLFRAKQHNTNESCLELFRWAIVEQSQLAWKALHEQYHKQMLNWARGSQGMAEDIVQGAWEKFLNSVTPDIFARFASIGAIMSYLRHCIKSVIIDHARSKKREQLALKAWADLETLANQEKGRSPSKTLDDIIHQQFSQDVYSRLQDDEERLVIYLSFEIELKPQEISRQYPKHFSTARQVSRIKERVIRRLSNDPMLRKKYNLS